MTSFDEYFKKHKIEYSAFFYNPNIHPYKEYLKRFETLKEYSKVIGIELIHDASFMQFKWENEYKSMPQAERCGKCYERRLIRTAERASIEGFSHFSSTLLISPYQNHELLIDIGGKAAERYGIGLYYRDFREYFRDGQNMAREEGLYRQKYCGCIYSYNESKFKDKIKWD
jgi:predicted adenine nucleotide alpha hydrolase (AANH) superfamily ATPase